MLCALLVSSEEKTIQHFRSVALSFGCVLKVAESEEEYYEFAADTPFTAIFLDCESFKDDSIENVYNNLFGRFTKTKFYLFNKNSEFSCNFNDVQYIIGLSNVYNTFLEIFSQYENRPQEILTGIRTCINNDLDNLCNGKRLAAIYPNTTEKVDDKILSAFPIDLLPERVEFFSDSTAVYLLADTSSNNLNRLCYNVIIELHNINITSFAVFTDVITSFDDACCLFADVNSYATKLRLEGHDNDVYYYNNELNFLEPFDNIIKKAQATGINIRSGKGEAKIEAIIDGFLNQSQLGGASIVNIQFLVCEVLRSAFDEDVLYNNLFAIISSKNISELKNLLITVCAKELIGQGDLEVSGNDRIIRQICEIIENEYASELYLDRVAEQIYLSPAYISRIFKKSTGMNFVKYLNEVRLKKAAALLIEDDYPINEISKKVGFSDVSYFCSCFKKKYGMTTVQYRRAYVLKEIEV